MKVDGRVADGARAEEEAQHVVQGAAADAGR